MCFEFEYLYWAQREEEAQRDALLRAQADAAASQPEARQPEEQPALLRPRPARALAPTLH